MKLRERAACLAKILRTLPNSTIRKLEAVSSIPKSSVQRHKKNLKSRTDSIGHDFFETEEGQEWLLRMYVATIFVFGCQANVGAETIALYFRAILLTEYVAHSPSCIRNMKLKIRGIIDVYGESQIKEILEICKSKELHLGADETFFGESLFLVLMELRSGFIFTEALVENRQYKTWWENVKEKLSQFQKILSFTSDAGQAVLKLGKTLKCNPVIDLFHLLKDPVALFGTKFHSKRKSLLAKLKNIKKNSVALDNEAETSTSINNKLAILDKGQKSYKNALFTISTAVHPFKEISEKHTSKALHALLTKQLQELKTISETCEIKDNKNLLKRFERRILPVSQLNDLWHSWVSESVACKTANTEVQKWAIEYLLPYFYFKEQFRKSKKNKGLREYYQTIVAQAKLSLYSHPFTQEYLNVDWENWAQAMSLKYQRTTSAIEGRNARLSQHYFSSRGIQRSHINSLTVIHNFWIKRQDQTTAAERLSGFKPPDLFEYILQNICDIPLPRKRGVQEAIAI